MEQVQQFLPFILMFVVIYFFMIRPQQKRVKQEKQFEADIKVGDKIVTKSGIHAKFQNSMIPRLSLKPWLENSKWSVRLFQWNCRRH